MTGAALLPGGNDAARPSPVTGMLRYNSQAGTPVSLEYYDGAAWSSATGGGAGTIVAWVNFDGSGAAPVIRASSNVSSVTGGGGSGQYDVNFTTPLASANYALALARTGASASTINAFGLTFYSTTSIKLQVLDGTSSASPNLITAAFIL